MRGNPIQPQRHFRALARLALVALATGVVADYRPAAADQVWGGISELTEIVVAADRREFQKAALTLGENLKGLYPEIRSDARPCETAINRGASADIRRACRGGDNVEKTPLTLSTAAMGHLALGQFFSAVKAIQALNGAESSPGIARLKRHLIAKSFWFPFAILDDRARGGPAVVESMHTFDGAVALAESQRWTESCDALDRDMPTLPEFRTIHLLRFVICARAGADRSTELRSYAAIADPTAQVFAAFLLAEFPYAELLLRVKNVSPFADWYVERHFYAAEMAYLTGDQATYRAHLQKVIQVKDVRLFEQRLAIAESR
jgi:hypothetical protein